MRPAFKLTPYATRPQSRPPRAFGWSVARPFDDAAYGTGAEALASPADIVLGPRTLVQPDVFVVRKSPERPVRAWADVGVPLLVIEVLSSGTAARDRGVKRRTYQNAGVGEYWIVDPDARIVERWTPADERPEVVDGTLRWSLSGGACGELDVPPFFRRVHGD